MHPLTFADLLRARGSAATPLVTHYDLADGGRIELSVASFANWVAKTSALVLDLVDRGDSVFLDLPVHWLEPVLAGAAWNSGLVVVGTAEEADLVVCGPAGIESHAGRTVPVVATSLHPLGLRFDHALPRGIVDFGAEVFGQPDSFIPFDPAGPEDDALRTAGSSLSQRALVELGTSSPCGAAGVRTIADVPTTRRPDLLVGALAGGGGTVWVSSADEEGWAATAAAEGATVEVREDGDQPARS